MIRPEWDYGEGKTADEETWDSMVALVFALAVVGLFVLLVVVAAVWFLA